MSALKSLLSVKAININLCLDTHFKRVVEIEIGFFFKTHIFCMGLAVHIQSHVLCYSILYSWMCGVTVPARRQQWKTPDHIPPLLSKHLCCYANKGHNHSWWISGHWANINLLMVWRWDMCQDNTISTLCSHSNSYCHRMLRSMTPCDQLTTETF